MNYQKKLNFSELKDYEKVESMFENLDDFPQLKRMFERSKTESNYNLCEANSDKPPLHDGLFIRQLGKYPNQYMIEGEFNVTSPSQSLSLKLDIYDKKGETLELLKEGKTFVSFGGAQKVVASNLIEGDIHKYNNIVAVLTAAQVVNDRLTAEAIVAQIELGETEVQAKQLNEIIVEDPRSKRTPPADHIYICYTRGAAGREKNDYEVPKNKTYDFYIPLKGKAIFSNTADTFSEVITPNSKVPGPKSQLLLSMRDGGGIIEYDNTAEEFTKAFSPYEEKSGNVVIKRGFEWDFKETPWIRRNPFPSGITADVDFNLVLLYRKRTDKPSDKPHSLLIRSFTVPETNDGKEIPFIRIFWGCLHPDTLIKMSDGSEKKIKDIFVGDSVQTPKGSRKIADVITGREERGFLRIETESKEVFVSDEHPIVTEKGILTAKELTLEGGYRISTIGETYEILMNITRYIFEDDTVHNLVLEQDAGDYKDSTFYANGILVGDNNLQKMAAESYMLKYRNEYGIGEEWRTDVENAAKADNIIIYNQEDILWKS